MVMTSQSLRIPAVKSGRAKWSAIVALAIVLASAAASAQMLDIPWYTVDGGGGGSAGGTFSLTGTIGQPDASSFATPMSGGAFTVVGGFWPAAGSVCTLMGDINLDGQRNGADVQLFVNCAMNPNGANCGCSDFD